MPPDGVRRRFAAEPAEAPFRTAYRCLPIDPGAFNSVAQCCSLAVWASRRSRSCFSSSSVRDFANAPLKRGTERIADYQFAFRLEEDEKIRRQGTGSEEMFV